MAGIRGFEKMIDGAGALLAKLDLFIDLDKHDKAVLQQLLHQKSEAYVRGTNLIVEGMAHHNGFIILDGWAISYKTMPDGARQILSFLMPGDIVGLFAPVATISTETVEALNKLKVVPFAFDDILSATASAPRIGVALGWVAAREREILAEHLVSVGRRSAMARVAHLFLEFWARLRIRGISVAPTFNVPITQNELADALGLSVVHINRTLKTLENETILQVQRHKITIHDLEALQQTSGFTEAFLLNHYAPAPIRRRVLSLTKKVFDRLENGTL